MWQTFVIWRVMNAPLPVFNPFRRLLKLKLTHKPSSDTPTVWQRIFNWIPTQILSCLVGLAVLIMTVWLSLLCIVLVTPFVFIFFGSLPALMFTGCVITGGYLSLKISNKLGKVRLSGIYDLIGVTSYGDQQSMWLIGRTIYKDMMWLKDTRIMMTNTILIIIGFLVLMTVLGFISSIATPATSAINLLFLQTVIGLAFLMIAVYLSFVHAMVMGYLVALWSVHITTDSLNRSISVVASFIGIQLGVYILAYLLLAIGLPNFYDTMRWDTFFTLGFLQVVGLAIIHDLSVRVM
ncbi:MAG: hypothetical protein KJ043_14475, partial [Anaerolineae bacterium]|nr:hypothetical protein [Anaerolineae bacterium]